jgi:hypothetical protein
MAPRKKSAEDKPKNPGGRPTVYRQEYAKIARAMCERGATDAELADAFDVSSMTIWRWRARYPAFSEALKVAKGEFDDRVERSLAQRAVGYSYDTVKIFLPAGSREPVIVPYREHVCPDAYAAFKWLNCRRRLEWTDSKELTSPGPISPIIALLSEINGGTVNLIDERENHRPSYLQSECLFGISPTKSGV